MAAVYCVDDSFTIYQLVRLVSYSLSYAMLRKAHAAYTNGRTKAMEIKRVRLQLETVAVAEVSRDSLAIFVCFSLVGWLVLSLQCHV